jgi:hypothetical protein
MNNFAKSASTIVIIIVFAIIVIISTTTATFAHNQLSNPTPKTKQHQFHITSASPGFPGSDLFMVALSDSHFLTTVSPAFTFLIMEESEAHFLMTELVDTTLLELDASLIFSRQTHSDATDVDTVP